MNDERRQTDDGVRILGSLLLSALATGGCFWLAALASLFVSGDPLGHAPFSRSPQFAIGLFDSGSPSRAWHTTNPDAANLGAPIFWAILGIVVAVLIIAIIAIGRGRRRHGGVDAPARWATRATESKLAVASAPNRRRWRLTAGRGLASRRLLAGKDCVSAVVFGPNGSGKTTSLIVPNAIDWEGPVVITTSKSQDLAPIVRARGAKGPIWIIAPGGAPGYECVGWSPLPAATDEEAADRLAEWMVESSGMTDDPKARPWNAQARKYLKGLLLAANASGSDLEQWIRWIHSGDRVKERIAEILDSSGYPHAAREYMSTWQIHEEGQGSVLFTALGLADTYSRPGVVTSAADGGFEPAALFDGSGTLCIVTPNSEGDRYAPYFTALVTAVIHEAEERAARSGGPIKPRLLLALDEAGNVFRYPRLPHLLTTARGNGVQLMLVYHDLAQVEHLYGGRQVARTVLSNAKMRMLLPGVGDLETLRYWSDLMGQTRTQTHGVTTGFDGKRSRSSSEHNDHLAPLHQLQQLPDHQAVLLYENLAPTKVRLIPWYVDRRYRHLRG